MIKNVIWQGRWWLVYNGKKYQYPNDQIWGPYSKVNEILGLPTEMTATDTEMNALPTGNFTEAPSPDTLNNAGKTLISNAARQGGSSYETAASVAANLPVTTTQNQLATAAGDAQRRIDSGGYSLQEAITGTSGYAGMAGMAGTFEQALEKAYEKLKP
mgnify:FL=1